MSPQIPLLIVFTDELGSTSRDQLLFQEYHKQNNTEYKQKITNCRANLFKDQLDNLWNQGTWTVLKTVGDCLIISLNAPSEEKFGDILHDCLGSLFYIWKNSRQKEQKIRIVCHLTYQDEIVTGDDLSEIRNCFQTVKDNVVVTPVLNSIKTDIFGPAMNKAARLASIPRSSLFVVSQQVMEFMFKSDNIKMHIEKRESCDLKFKFINNENVNVRAYPIPVTNLKGFESDGAEIPGEEQAQYCISKEEEGELRSYLRPWYIWEIEEAGSKIETAEDSLPLRVQFKELQSLKIVAGKFIRKVESNKLIAQNLFENHRLSVNPCKLFVDMVFRISKTYTYFPTNLFRMFNGNGEKPSWKDAHAPLPQGEKPRPLQYMYVMFTSVPDMKTNWLLRKYFIHKTEEWSFQHISYDVYESSIFSDRAKFINNKISFTTVNNTQKTGNHHYLLLFQIREEHADDADDWVSFFTGRKYLLKNYGECCCISYGLLRGEFDGFVLFSAGEDRMKDLQDDITEGMDTSGSFFFKIAPIFLLDLELYHVSEENIQYLKEIRKKYDLLNVNEISKC